MMSKKASNKSRSELNLVEKSPRAHMSISPRSGARGSKDQHVWNLKMYRNGKLGLLYGSTLPKIRMISKKIQIKAVGKCKEIKEKCKENFENYVTF